MKYLYLEATTPPDPALAEPDGTGYPCFCVYVHKPTNQPAYAQASLGHKTLNSFTSIFDTTPRPRFRATIAGPATLAKKRQALTAVLDWLDAHGYVTPGSLAAARHVVTTAKEIEA